MKPVAMRDREHRFSRGYVWLFLLAVIGLPRFSDAQTGATAPNEWTWVNGANENGPILCDPLPCTPGVFAPGVIPPPLELANTWTDLKGNLWLYGGALGSVSEGPVGGSVWEFDPSLSEWAWMAGSDSYSDDTAIYGTLGVPAADNHPGWRLGSASWADSQGRLWVFGGYGYTTNGAQQTIFLNDLWVFDPSTTYWTWMGGSAQGSVPAVYGTMGTPAAANLPPARIFASTWTDKSGRFWLYGGQSASFDLTGSDAYLNDMWVYDPSAATWEWVSGNTQTTQSPFQTAVYGTLGVPSSSNSPGARIWDSTWTDNNGNLWLFSGLSEPNDLWEFNPATSQWAWMAGSNVLGTETCGGTPFPPCPEHGFYGTLGVPAPGNIPGARQNALGWTDKDGSFWLFGGEGEDAESDAGTLNDLWKFNPLTNQWAWVGGNSTFICGIGMYGYECLEVPVFGTMGAPSASNNPGGRQGAATWVDNSGNLWLFSGASTTSNGGSAQLNDTWEYSPSASSLPPAITPIFSLPAGNYQSTQTLTISNGMNNASFFYTTDGTTPTSNSSLYTVPITISSTQTVQAIATGPGYPQSGLTSATYSFQADPPTFSEPAGTYDSAIMVGIADGTNNAAIYYTTDGSTPTSASTQYMDDFPFTVSSSETIKAIAVANGYSSPVASISYIIVLPGISLTALPSSLTLKSGDSGTVTITVTPSDGFNSVVGFACSGLPSGATCSFSPATVTPAAAAVTTQLTITAGQSAALRPDSRSPFPAPVLALAVCLFSFKRRRARQFFFLAIAAITFSLATACGSGGSGSGGGGGGTQPVTSTVTVTATSGTVQQTATIQLTLN